ncbi:MAG: type II toxin-antitoxin system PemK/MazF family toxin [Gemmatimonadaceae bacterium]|nr:type II toxin-antitoxin system PemK/MazF family toxin [Gloeobacterales cyanobacterium ES-bin-141]
MHSGAVLFIGFPVRQPTGREQQGDRPAIVVGIPETVALPRFPLLLVVPVTTDRNQTWALTASELYPRLPAGAGGLRVSSIALLDQLCAVDRTRVGNYIGSLTASQYQPIRECLLRLLS